MNGAMMSATSRLAMASAVGILLSLGSAKAADLGGNCCADLEERVAELEATTV
ncbi:MAG: porin, partial [Hyphomicrobiales bacterium]